MYLHRSIVARLLHWATKVRATRAPDVVIGGHERPYLLRWFVIPRNPLFNIYLHEFRRSDDDRALHDHPWLFNASLLISGDYVEHTIDAGGIHRHTSLSWGAFKLRLGPAAHRIELVQVSSRYKDGRSEHYELPCVTLFITGPRIREWGFHCPEQGWIPWQRFTAANDPGAIGKGCEG